MGRNIIVSYCVWLMATRTAKLLPHLWQRPQDIIYVPAFILFGYYFAVMKIYALLTLHEVSPGLILHELVRSWKIRTYRPDGVHVLALAILPRQLPLQKPIKGWQTKRMMHKEIIDTNNRNRNCNRIRYQWKCEVDTLHDGRNNQAIVFIGDSLNECAMVNILTRCSVIIHTRLLCIAQLSPIAHHHTRLPRILDCYKLRMTVGLDKF